MKKTVAVDGVKPSSHVLTTLNKQGVALFKQKEFKAAIDCFSQIIPHSQEAPPRYNCARAYEQLGDTPNAIQTYEALLALHPEHKEGLRQLCCVFQVKKDWDLAFYYLNKAGVLGDLVSRVKADWIKAKEGAKVEWYSVDMKKTDSGEFKILEMGEGFFSGFSGYNIASVMAENGGRKFQTSWHRDVMSQRVAATLTSVLPMPLVWAPGADGLNYPLIAQEQVPISQKTGPFDLSDLSHYSVAVSKSAGLALAPDQLTLCASVPLVMAATTKLSMNLLKEHTAAHALFPKTQEYKKGNADAIAQTIMRDFSGHRSVVIKHSDLEGGTGVHVVALNKQALTTAIQTYFSQPLANMAAIDFLNLDLTKLWASGTSRYDSFLVQEYLDTPCVVSGKKYDVTIRASIIVVRDKGQIRTHLVDAFYRLPPEAMGHTGADQIVSQGSSVKLMTDPERADMQSFFSSGETRRFFQESMAFDMEAYLRDSPQTGQSSDLHVVAMCILGRSGVYDAALSYVTPAMKKSTDYRFFEAKMFYLKGDYLGAIQKLTDLIAIAPTGASYHIRAKCYGRMGDFVAAKKELLCAKEFGPNPQYLTDLGYVEARLAGRSFTVL